MYVKYSALEKREGGAFQESSVRAPISRMMQNILCFASGYVNAGAPRAPARPMAGSVV